MAEIKVNPTRMELKKLKLRLSTARRGHKLLKDKRDELMRQFLDIVREAKALREKLDAGFASVNAGFASAAAVTDKKILTESLMLPKTEGELDVDYKNIMSVIVPVFQFHVFGAGYSGTNANYGYAFTSGELDDAVAKLGDMLEDLVELARLEKTALMLCDEIERTRRRVNALEYIMIPQLEDGIKRISMKLDENERGNLTRLMKVKDMMIKAQIEAKSDFDDDIFDDFDIIE